MRLYGFTLLLSCLILLSCNSGGETLVPPVIESIHPTGIVGTPGDTIAFSAVVTGASGSATYAWSFGGGGTADDPTSPTPLVTLGSVDSYAGSLTVTDGETSDVAPFSFEVVNVPVVQSVTPTGNVGLPLGEVQFSAEVLGEPTEWKWSFSGGVLPEDSGDESPVLTLQNPGTYAGSLEAINSNGTSEPFPFEFTVEQPVAPSWTFVKVGMERADGPRGLCAKVVDGHLVLAYNMQINDSGNLRNAIRYTRATVEMPTSETQFESHTVVLESDTEHPRLSGWQGMAFSEEGIPYLLFGTTTAQPGLSKLARANSSNPASPSDWDVSEVEYNWGNNRTSQILTVRENSLFALVQSSSGLMAFESDSLAPAEQANWTRHVIVAADGLPHSLPYLQIASGNRIQIVASRYVGHAFSPILFTESTDATPEATSDWAKMTVDIRDAAWEQDNYLALQGDLPVVFAPGSYALLQAALIYTSSEPHPTNIDDFTPVQVSPDGTRAEALGLTLSGNRLAGLYRDLDLQQLGIARQTGANASESGHWSTTTVTPPTQDPESPATVLTLGGRLIIVFVDPRDNRLTLAIADGEF